MPDERFFLNLGSGSRLYVSQPPGAFIMWGMPDDESTVGLSDAEWRRLCAWFRCTEKVKRKEARNMPKSHKSKSRRAMHAKGTLGVHREGLRRG
jgi:hypothetical protein